MAFSQIYHQGHFLHAQDTRYRAIPSYMPQVRVGLFCRFPNLAPFSIFLRDTLTSHAGHWDFHIFFLQSTTTLQIDLKIPKIKPSTVIDDLAWNISGHMGLVSAGRINKDTPPLTTPSHTSKSSAMDTSSYIF